MVDYPKEINEAALSQETAVHLEALALFAQRFEHYRDKPSDFIREVLGRTIWERQEEIVESVQHNMRVAVPSASTVGKSFIAAATVITHTAINFPAITLTTAPTWNQVSSILWREIRMHYQNSRFPLGGNLSEVRWRLSDDHWAMGLSTNDYTRFQGFHGENLLVVVDEPQGVEREMYDVIESLTLGGDPRVLLIGNPVSDSDWFHDICEGRLGIGYTKIRIDALDSPNIKAGEVIPAYRHLVTPQQLDLRRRQHGENSWWWKVFVRGQFVSGSQDTLITMGDIIRVQEAAKASGLYVVDDPVSRAVHETMIADI